MLDAKYVQLEEDLCSGGLDQKVSRTRVASAYQWAAHIPSAAQSAPPTAPIMMPRSTPAIFAAAADGTVDG